MNMSQKLLLVTCSIMLLSGTAIASQLSSDNSSLLAQTDFDITPLGDDAHDVSTPIEDAAQRQNMAQWEKKRATYLRDLNLAALDQKADQLSDNQYLLAEKLIQATLNIAYAQTDRVTLSDPQSAKQDLRNAIDNIETASNLATSAEKPRIEKVKRQLVSVLYDTSTRYCESNDEEMHNYRDLQAQLALLIKDIGANPVDARLDLKKLNNLPVIASNWICHR